MSKSDPISNKEILVGVGTALFGVLLIVLTIVLAPDASESTLIKASLGAILAALFATLTLPWWVRQDAKRRERKHIREYHSDVPKP
jgi:uncharacterized membrane protein YccC